MKRDAQTLPLFATEQLPTQARPMPQGLPAHWTPSQRENFTWWCQHGNNSMCAAVLWQGEGFSTKAAAALVKNLHGQPITEMHESPACAHFARTKSAVREATA